MSKKRHSKALKALLALISSALFISSALIMTRACSEGGVQYTLVQDLPDFLALDETYEMIVDCRNMGAVPYDVWAVITLYGPSGETFTNGDVFINWISCDENGNVISNFTLGRNLWGWSFHWDFTQINGNIINWTEMPTRMNSGVYRRHVLYVSILGSAPIGNYKVVINILGEKTPVQAEVSITPKVLNFRSRGKWVEACIRLPKPYDIKNIDMNSLKLWFKDNFVQAEWGKVEEGYLIAKFPRDKIIEILKGERGPVELTVTGLVNGIEFCGTDTIKII